jgi:hypothetical protein
MVVMAEQVFQEPHRLATTVITMEEEAVEVMLWPAVETAAVGMVPMVM